MNRLRGFFPSGLLLGTLGLGVFVLPPDCAAQSAVEESPVEGAISDSVWYDSEAGGVIPVSVTPEVDDSLNRDSRWLPKAKRVRKSTTPAGGGGGGGGGAGGLFGSGLSIANVLGWFLLIVIAAAAAAAIIYGLSKAEIDMSSGGGSKANRQRATPDEQMIERMKHLPAELRRTDVNLRTEAERLMKEGQYDQAIILLFGHQLLLLDRVGWLRLNRGKTNRRYVRETRSADRDSAKRLQGTVTAFEKSYFGRHEITQREFSELWRSNEAMERTIDLQREVAA